MTKSYKNPENLELSILTRANKFLSSSESVSKKCVPVFRGIIAEII